VLHRPRPTAALAPIALFSWASLFACGESGDRRPDPAPAVFGDVTRHLGVSFRHRSGAAGDFHLPEIMGPGGALFDFDGDGDLDLYCVQGGSLARSDEQRGDRLFRNDLDPAARTPQRFTDVTEDSGIAATGYGMGAASGDFDNDGRVDLYLANFGPNQLWRNRGDGSFEELGAAAGVDERRWSTSAAFLDFDRDGWLDLFVTNYVNFQVASHVACRGPDDAPDYCAPTTYRGEPDRLYRNRGDGSFEDVSGPAGILAAYGNGLGVVTTDFDADGWVDIYVANDRQPNFLWRNRGDGTFEDVAFVTGAAVNMEGLAEASMGVDTGDVDNDGDEDLFITHLNGETNTLYRNTGDGGFEDSTNLARLGLASIPFTGFGTAFLDFDNDGWLDIVVANGAVSASGGDGAVDLPSRYSQPDQLFRNLRGERFEQLAEAALEVAHVSRGTAVGDIDNDGDPDVVIFDTDGGTRVLGNRVGSLARWLGLRLLTGAPGRDALGARVQVMLPDGTSLWRRVRADASYLSANDPRVLVGLGDHETARGLRVEWPDGSVETFPPPATGRYSVLEQGGGSRRTSGHDAGRP
jgi:hypothetical protein